MFVDLHPLFRYEMMCMDTVDYMYNILEQMKNTLNVFYAQHGEIVE